MATQKFKKTLKKESSILKKELTKEVSETLDKKVKKLSKGYFTIKLNKRIEKLEKEAFRKWNRKAIVSLAFTLIIVLLFTIFGAVQLLQKVERNANERINTITEAYKIEIAQYELLLYNRLDSITSTYKDIMFQAIDEEIKSKKVQKDIQTSINQKVQQIAPLLIEKFMENKNLDSTGYFNTARNTEQLGAQKFLSER